MSSFKNLCFIQKTIFLTEYIQQIIKNELKPIFLNGPCTVSIDKRPKIFHFIEN